MNGKRMIIWLSLLVLALIVVHDLVLVLLSAGLFREKFNQDAFGYARMSARPVAEAYERYYQSGYYKFRELIGDAMRMNPDLMRLSLIDVNGTVLFDSRELAEGKATRPAAAAPPDILDAVKGLTLTCRVAGDETGNSVLDIVVPYVEEWGRHRYSVRYQIRYRSWGDARSRLWLRLFLAGIISFVLGACAAVPLMRWLMNRHQILSSRIDAES